MAQYVDVKGHGLVEFPDDVQRSVMLDALRNKFSKLNQGETVSSGIAAPYSPTLAERAAGAISSGLQKTGLISDNYRANRIGENITMGLEALPVIGDAIGGDELGRAIRDGDVIGGGFAALGAIPIAGDAAKAVGTAGGKLITSVSDLFDYTPDMLANQLKQSDPSKVAGEAWRDQKRAFYTDYLPDGSAEMYKNDGTLIKRMEPEEAKRLYRERILEIETQKPEAQAILERRRLDDEAAARAQREASESDYRMMHRAPTRDGNPTADDLSGLFDDIYGPNALRLNSTGAPYDRKAIQIIQSMRGNPDKEITIYRAVPKGIKDINQGDWVTATKEYAEQHAKYDPSYVVISKKVKARDIATDGNSIHEFGYDPQQN